MAGACLAAVALGGEGCFYAGGYGYCYGLRDINFINLILNFIMQIENDIQVNPLYMVYNEVRGKNAVLKERKKDRKILDHPQRRNELVRILL